MKRVQARAIPMQEAVELWRQHDPSVKDLTYQQLRCRLRRLRENGRIDAFQFDYNGVFLYKNTDIIKLAKANARKSGANNDTKQQNELDTNCNQLPDWCHPGHWVYDERNGYGEIKSVREDRSACFIEFGERAGVFIPEAFDNVLKQAIVKPFSAEEVPVLPFEVCEKNSNFRTCVVSCDGEKVWLAGAVIAISTEELELNFTFPNGLRCGNLMHLKNGELVK